MRPRRSVLVAILACAVPVIAQPAASPPAAGTPVAALNAESKRLSEVEPERAMALARQAVDEARRQRLAAEEAEGLHNVAVAFRAMGAFDQAAQAGRQSVEAFQRLGDTRGEAQGFNTLGLVALDRGHYEEALEHQLRALAIRDRAGDREGLGYSYNNLGNIYRATGDYRRALDYHRQALAIKIEMGNTPSQAFSHHNIGHVYRAMGDVAHALEAYRAGLAIREGLGDQWGVAASLNSIGQLEAEANPQAALATYGRALAIRRGMGDWRGEADTLNNIGNVHRQLGDTKEALAALTRALAITSAHEYPVARVETLRSLSDAEDLAGNPRAALAWHREYVVAKDHLFNQQNAQRIAGLQAAYESERREQQIRLLELDRERAVWVRRGLIGLLVFAIASLVALYLRFRFKHQSEARLRAQAAELAEALDRARMLRGLLPICASCKKIRDDNGYWTQVEAYVRDQSDAEFTHSLCPDCTEELYPGLMPRDDTAHVN